LRPEVPARFTRTIHSGSQYPSSPSLSRALTWGTFGVCSIVFAYNFNAKRELAENKNRKPTNFMQQNMICSLQNWQAGRWWTLLASSINHVDLMHLGFNMYALHSFGPIAISTFGPGGYVALWLVSSVTCSAGSIYWQALGSKSQGRQWGPNARENGGSIGSSGALLGMTSALMCRYPHLPIGVAFLPIAVPLWAFSALFAAFSGYCMVQNQLTWLGHAGHLGGMVGGIATYAVALRPWLRRLRM